MAKIVFDKLCECETVQDNYFYRKVTYDYELLEDYQELYSDFQEPKPSQQHSPDLQAQQPSPNQDHNWGPKHFKYHTHPLYLMVSSTEKLQMLAHFFLMLLKVRYKRKDLLGHELVTSFLCMRWNMFLKYLYYINLLTYIVLMLLLTLYVHIYFTCKQLLDS